MWHIRQREGGGILLHVRARRCNNEGRDWNNEDSGRPQTRTTGERIFLVKKKEKVAISERLLLRQFYPTFVFLPRLPFFYPAFRFFYPASRFFTPPFGFFTPPSVFLPRPPFFLPRPPFFYPALRFFTPPGLLGLCVRTMISQLENVSLVMGEDSDFDAPLFVVLSIPCILASSTR